MTLPLRWERSFVLILLAVCGLHLGLIGYLCLQSPTLATRPPRKTLRVQSIQLQPVSKVQPKAPTVQSNAPAVQPKGHQEHPSPPLPSSSPPPAPIAASKPATPAVIAAQEPLSKSKKKKAADVGKPVVKKDKVPTPSPSSPQPLKKSKISADKIAQVKADLKKIDRSEIAVTASASASMSQVVEEITVDSAPSYEEILSARLRLLLTLPDYGNVKISLRLDRQGKVIALTILKSASDENQQYVEKTLPRLTLPPFGRSFGAEAQHTFQLVLSN